MASVLPVPRAVCRFLALPPAGQKKKFRPCLFKSFSPHLFAASTPDRSQTVPSLVTRISGATTDMFFPGHLQQEKFNLSLSLETKKVIPAIDHLMDASARRTSSARICTSFASRLSASSFFSTLLRLRKPPNHIWETMRARVQLICEPYHIPEA